MLIVCYGVQKSASTYIFLLAKDLLEVNGYDQEKLKKKYLGSKYNTDFLDFKDGEAAKLSELIPANKPVIFKTHSPMYYDMCIGHKLGKIKSIVSYREPRDICLSLLDLSVKERAKSARKAEKTFARIYTLDDAIEYVKDIYQESRNWMFINHSMKFDFDFLVEHPVDIMGKLCKFLKLIRSDEGILEKYEQDKSQIPWFNKGKPARWKSEMSETDRLKCDSNFSEIYELQKISKSMPMDWIPPFNGCTPLTSFHSYSIANDYCFKKDGFGDNISVYNDIYVFVMKETAHLNFYIDPFSHINGVELRIYTEEECDIVVSLNDTEIGHIKIMSSKPVDLGFITRKEMIKNNSLNDLAIQQVRNNNKIAISRIKFH